MARFKVGDKVRYVNPETAKFHHNDAGYRGVVTHVSEGCYWFDSGGTVEVCFADEIENEYELELVAPTPSIAPPIREVTKRELAPGPYGNLNAADLLAAAKMLTEIADYLESQSATESAH